MKIGQKLHEKSKLIYKIITCQIKIQKFEKKYFWNYNYPPSDMKNT